MKCKRRQGPLFAFLRLLLLLLLVLLSACSCNASDISVPHSHTGKVAPFEPGDPKVTLNAKALSILSSGSPYQTTIHVPGSTSGRGLVVQDVHAPPDVVWDRILDFDHYVGMVPKTAESSNYQVIRHKATKRDPLEQTIFTKMKVGLPLVPKMTFFVKHLYYPELNSLTWTLDYTRKSDFDDSVGYWYVIPHPTLPNWSRVYYSVSVSMYDWVPKAVVNFMSTKALTDATGWVKRFSEEYWRDDPRRGALEAESEEGDGSAAIIQTKKKKLVKALFARFAGGRKSLDGDGASNTMPDTSTCDSSVNTCDSVEVLSVSIPAGKRTQVVSGAGNEDDDSNKPSKVVTVQQAAVRVTLILLVSSLLVYNISLFLDRMSQ